MDSDSIRNIRPGQPVDPTGPQGTPPPPGDTTEFRRLLERLESLSQGEPTPQADGADPDIDSPEDLARDLAKADDEFRSAMDLRRRLEDAFRNLGP